VVAKIPFNRKALAVATVGLLSAGLATALPYSASAQSANNYGPSGAVPAVGTKIQGGTAYFQEGPAAPPTYIFPFISPQVCSTMNYGQFTYLMYRPLYWFGNNNSPPVDYNYSIGNPPVWSNGDKTVTVTLKNWKWVQQRGGHQPRRRGLDEHDVRRGAEVQLVRLHPGVLPRQRGVGGLPQRQHRGVPPEDGGQPDPVPLQRAVPGHEAVQGTGGRRPHNQPGEFADKARREWCPKTGGAAV
jgi:hypothetical protein